MNRRYRPAGDGLDDEGGTKAPPAAPGNGSPHVSVNPSSGTVHGSFGELLSELRSLFPSALVDGFGWARLLALAHRLPISVTDNRFGFEFDLCDPDPAADFCVAPQPGSRLADYYVRQGELAAPESAEAALGAFLADHASGPRRMLAEGRGWVILEYDLAGISADQSSPPGIFIVPGDARDEPGREKLFGEPERLAGALWAVAGRTPDPAILQQMEHIYRMMPTIASVCKAGILPGRTQRAVRLIIQTRAAEDAAELLKRIRWPGRPADVAAVCESVAGLTRPGADLSVDVTADGVSPRLGLEFFRPVEWYELDRPGWNRLIDRLEERGWCLPEKARGLRAWPRVEQIFDRSGVHRIWQSINHVKMVVNCGATSAKAYAGMHRLKVA